MSYGHGGYGAGIYGIGELPEDRIADHRLEISFGGGIGAPFRFGKSAFSSTDVFEKAWVSRFTGPRDDVTDDVAEGALTTITRGLDQRLQSITAGQYTTTLIKPSNISYFDPNDPTSPLFLSDPGFVTMRPLRHRSSYDDGATWQGMFYGFLRDAEYDPETGLCRIVAEDLFLWMQRVDNPIIPLQTGITSSQAVGLILDSFGFTDPVMRNLSTLPTITSMNFSADGTVGTLDLLKGVLDAEQGRAFVDGDGVFHFEDRYARERRRTASYVFATELIDITSRASADDIGNRVTVTKTGGVPQVKIDTPSKDTYGASDITSLTSPYLPSDTAAGSLAALILKRSKDPHPPQVGAIYNEDLTVVTSQLLLELQDRATFSGTDGYVERLEHVIAPGGIDLKTTLFVSKVPATSVFQFAISKIAAVGDLTADYIAA